MGRLPSNTEMSLLVSYSWTIWNHVHKWKEICWWPWILSTAFCSATLQVCSTSYTIENRLSPVMRSPRPNTWKTANFQWANRRQSVVKFQLLGCDAFLEHIPVGMVLMWWHSYEWECCLNSPYRTSLSFFIFFEYQRNDIFKPESQLTVGQSIFRRFFGHFCHACYNIESLKVLKDKRETMLTVHWFAWFLSDSITHLCIQMFVLILKCLLRFQVHAS